MSAPAPGEVTSWPGSNPPGFAPRGPRRDDGAMRQLCAERVLALIFATLTARFVTVAPGDPPSRFHQRQRRGDCLARDVDGMARGCVGRGPRRSAGHPAFPSWDDRDDRQRTTSSRAGQTSTDPARSRNLHAPLPPVAYDCVKLILVRHGSAILLSEFERSPSPTGT